MKNLKKALALLLVLVMLFSLSACALVDKLGGMFGKKTNKELCGEWHCNFDYTEAFSAEFETLGITLPESAKAYMVIDMTLNEDGTIVMGVNKEKTEESLNEFEKNVLVPVMSDYLCDLFGMTAEEIEGLVGMSMEDYILESFGDTGGLFDTIDEERFEYKVDGDRIYFFDEGEAPGEDEYAVYELKDGKLCFNEIVEAKAGGTFYEMFGDQLPLVFEK